MTGKDAKESKPEPKTEYRCTVRYLKQTDKDKPRFDVKGDFVGGLYGGAGQKELEGINFEMILRPIKQ